MARERGARREHIRAAKDWLGEAEDSLAEDNDVRGDLKVMLAKAELAQAGESRPSRRLRSWGARVLPLLVAVLLADGGLVLYGQWQAGTRPSLTSTASVSQESSDTATGGEAAAAGRAPAEAAAASPAAETPDAAAAAYGAGPTPPPAPDSAAPVAHDTPSASGASAAPSPAPAAPAAAAAPAPQPSVPAADMQKLMQSAGEILRQ